MFIFAVHYSNRESSLERSVHIILPRYRLSKISVHISSRAQSLLTPQSTLEDKEGTVVYRFTRNIRERWLLLNRECAWQSDFLYVMYAMRPISFRS